VPNFPKTHCNHRISPVCVDNADFLSDTDIGLDLEGLLDFVSLGSEDLEDLICPHLAV